MNIETILYQLKDGYSLTEIVENPTKEKFIISVLKDYSQLKAEKCGEWVDVGAGEFDDTNRCYRCSVCGKEINGYDIGYYFKFCHGCGAKMKEEENQ